MLFRSRSNKQSKNMTHFGVLFTPGIGHLNPMTTLAYELKQRGHRVSFVGIPYPVAKAKAEAAGLEFVAISDRNLSQISNKDMLELKKKKGLAGIQYVVDLIEKETSIFLELAPTAIREAETIEALLIDQGLLGGEIVAEFLNLPYITVCCALLLNQEIGVPPFYTSWQYNPNWWALLRNAVGYQILNFSTMKMKKAIAEYRQKWKLPGGCDRNYLQLAILSQQPSEFEFPRQKLPQWFHFIGPLYRADLLSGTWEAVPFPWEKLTGQPLIYASMGTLQNRLVDVFEKIATACEGLDVQLVMSLGRSLMPEELPELPGNPIVVSYAPQLELLQKATLTITHAGLNTTLQSLSNGVPMVAIPISYEQPGIAARIVWTGVGEAIPLKRLSVSRLRKAITKVLTEDSYKQNAMRLQEAIKRAKTGANLHRYLSKPWDAEGLIEAIRTGLEK